MDPFRPFYDMVAPFIPYQYSILAQQWGLYSYWGPIVAFIAAVLLLFGLFYLGSLIAFGKLIGESESAKKALILISTTMGIIGAWYGAGEMLKIMSNLIFAFGIIIGLFVLLYIIGVIIFGGWHAASATVEEAKKQNVLAYTSMIAELKRMGYTDEQIERILKEKGLLNKLEKLFGRKDSGFKSNENVKSQKIDLYKYLKERGFNENEIYDIIKNLQILANWLFYHKRLTPKNMIDTILYKREVTPARNIYQIFSRKFKDRIVTLYEIINVVNLFFDEVLKYEYYEK